MTTLTAVCAVCGQAMPASAVMCPRCGTPFAATAQFDSDGATASSPVVARADPRDDADRPPAVPQPSPAAPARPPWCPECGMTDLPASATDCPCCGRALAPPLAGGADNTVPGANAQLAVAGQVVDLPAGETLVLGRDPAASPLAEALSGLYGVSRRHALVMVRGTNAIIQDLGSTNGTWLDGARLGLTPVTRALPARLRLGRSVEVEVRLAAPTPAPRLTPAPAPAPTPAPGTSGLAP